MESRWEFFDAIWDKTRHAFDLSFGAAAKVAARQELIAGLLHQLETLFLSADILECRHHTRRRFFEFLTAKSASLSLILLAGFSNVVRLRIALSTKDFFAFITTNPVISHVLSSYIRERLPLIVFLAFDDLTRFKHHDISATAKNKVRVLF